MKDKILKSSVWNTIKEYCLITLGVGGYALGWSIFLLPNNLIGGGVSGFASIVAQAFSYSNFTNEDMEDIFQDSCIVLMRKVKAGGVGYYEGLYTVSFAGVLPIDDPRLVVMTVIDEPHPRDCNAGGGTVAAPIFRAAAERFIYVLHLQPSDPAETSPNPIKWYNEFGSCAMECIVQPEGVIGDPKRADAEKARKGVEQTLDYLEKLVNDILEKYPAGTLPPIEMMTQRNREDIEAVIKGPNEPGGRHIYTLAY